MTLLLSARSMPHGGVSWVHFKISCLSCCATLRHHVQFGAGKTDQQRLGDKRKVGATLCCGLAQAK